MQSWFPASNTMCIAFPICKTLLSRSAVVFFVLAFACGAAFGQDYKEPVVIPPSPEAANLGKYGEFPVSYNTGTPQIDIPLHTISADDISLPISISYHAGGNKVTDVASWVGLGWTLNAGGVITRTMRGIPDELPNGYFEKWSEWQAKKNWPSPPSPTGPPMSDGWLKHQFQVNVANGIYDLNPDIFTFNFGGYSGRILFDQDRKPVIIPYQDFTIEHPFDGSGNQWVITTPEGLVFTFDSNHAEFTTPLSEGSSGPFYSTWHLSSITSLKSNAVISFIYTSVTLGGIETSPNNGIIATKKGFTGWPCEEDPPYPVGQSPTEYMINTKVLSQINFPKGQVSILSSADRLDYYQDVSYNGRRLYALFIMYSGNNPLSKKFTFSQSYFGASPSTRRLRLDEVLETGIDGLIETPKAPYKFEYNTTALPFPMSLERDHWGYYNLSGNTSLIPPLTASELQLYHNNLTANANRSSSEAGSKACILEKIIYPTGGYTKFNFEGHEYNDFIPATQSYTTSASGGSLKEYMNEYEQGLYDHHIIQGTQHAGSSSSIFINSETFTLTETKSVTLSHYISGSMQSIAETRIFKLPILNYDQPLYYNLNSTVTLGPGTYVLLAAASIAGTTVYSGMSYPYEYAGKIPAGGVRIAQLENFDGVNTYRKNFSYNLPSGASSSELFNVPEYKKTTPCGNLYVSANDLSIPSTHQGLHLGYSQVTVTDEGGENGKTVYKFMNSINDIMRSLVTRETYYDANNDIVKDIRYEYSPTMFVSFSPGITMKMIHRHHAMTFTHYYDFEIRDQQYATFFIYQSKITEEIVDNVLNTSLITERTIKQGLEPVGGSSWHTLPTEIVTKSSDGQRVIQKIINSVDPDPQADSPPAIKVPVKSLLIREDAAGQKWLVGAMHTRYDGNLPVEVRFLESSVPLSYTEGMVIPFTAKYTFTNNIHKKIVERKGTDEVVTAYLWDSDNINPIASVVNASQSSVAHTSFENSSNEGGWSFTINSTSGGKTGTHCHKFTATSISKTNLNAGTRYKISFWMKDNSPTVTNTSTATITPNPVFTGADGWKLYEYYTNEGATSVSVTAPLNTLIDELRLHPTDAQMTTYTYRPGAGISSVTDANNMTSYFTYDGASRLKNVQDENLDILKYFQYNYKN